MNHTLNYMNYMCDSNGKTGPGIGRKVFELEIHPMSRYNVETLCEAGHWYWVPRLGFRS